MTDERSARICAIAAVLLWSTVATGFKLGLRVLAPIELLTLGATISLAFFTLAIVATGRLGAVRALALRDWARLGALGLVNPFLYYQVLFEAYRRLPAQIAQPLNYTWAIALALLAVPVLGQRLDWRALAGIVVSYAGVVVLVGGGSTVTAAALDPLGIALALASTLIWAGYWLATVRIAVDPLVLMWVAFAVAAPAIAVVCAATRGLPALTLDALAYDGWVGLVEMGVTFLLWQTALKRSAHAGRTAQYIFLSPFISLVLIDRVLGERVHWTSVAGLALIVAGLVLTGRPRVAQSTAV